MGMGTNLILLLFCINFALYMAGYEGGFSYMANSGLKQTGNLFVNNSGLETGVGNSDSTYNIFLIFVGIALVSGIAGIFLGVLSGFAMVYIIPLAMIPIFMNLFIFPINFIFSQNLPTPIGLFTVGLLNILLFAAILSFVRGSEF